MMKRVLTILLMLVFLIGAIGVDVRAHYCGGELSMVSFNGLHIHGPGNKTMPGCGEGDGCPHCKNIHTHYKVYSKYHQARTVLQQPALSLPDWFHGDLPVALLAAWLLPLPVVSDAEAQPYAYLARSYPGATLPPSGLLAPPVG